VVRYGKLNNKFSGFFRAKMMKYIKNLKEYQGKSVRIEGFKKLDKSGLSYPKPLIVITHRAFKEYKKKGLTEPLQKEIEAVFLKVRKKNPRMGVTVRRAYVVPGLEHPPGPRTSSIKDHKILISEVKKLYDFAIKNKFDKKGSEIAAFFHPFINPKLPLGGGCVTGDGYNGKKGILIEAIYGNDEGVQTFPHDDYLLDEKKNRFILKVIHYKPRCLSAVSQLEYKTVPVPRKLRNAQVLVDKLILKIARHYRKLNNLFGPHRLEFDVLRRGIYYIEAVAFEKKEEEESAVQFSGKVLKVKNLDDIQKVKKTNRVIFVDPSIIKKRNMDLLTCLACNLPHKKVILYPGSTTTAHASIIFREMGHSVVYVGYEKFETGENVVIKIEEGELKAHRQLLV